NTGISGSIGVALSTGGNQGQSLAGGTKLAFGDLSSLSATPNFSLNVHSNLAIAFGVDFQMENGVYTDKSDFPSITADLILEQTIGGNSIAGASAPQVGLNNMQLDIGQAITKL